MHVYIKEDIPLKYPTRKICVFTGSRAEYGLLSGVMRRIADDPGLTLQIIASGMHLSPEFGMTYTDIERHGFTIDKKVEMLLSTDTDVGMSKSIGLGIIGVTDALEDLSPDILVILGDRFEALAAATAAMCLRIPIAHIHSGEITEGVIDEAIRHSITKMSHVHFTTTDVYRGRVIQLGEQPNMVMTVGSLGVENIKSVKLFNKTKVQKLLGFNFGKKNLLVTYHPVTLDEEEHIHCMLDALSSLEDIKFILTKSNADVDGRRVNEAIDSFVRDNADRAVAFTSLGMELYLSTLQYVDAVVGNSSSGIIEAPSFNIGTIDVGDRQAGRVKARSVIGCTPTRTGIEYAIEVLYSKEFQEGLKHVENPYEGVDTSLSIVNVLKGMSLQNILKKRFYGCELYS